MIASDAIEEICNKYDFPRAMLFYFFEFSILQMNIYNGCIY